MRTTYFGFLGLLLAVPMAAAAYGAEPFHKQRVAQVAETKGLVAFWDFRLAEDGRWTSYYDPGVVDRGYKVVLRRIGDPKPYSPDQWPYADEASELRYDGSGPFGRAVRMNKGYIFAEVPRSEFDGSPLDVHGRQPFTLIAWVQFIGARHLVAGIWDEGGWHKYRGRRQIALFGGLFGSRGVIGHVSTTGASSYPQSTIPGSQYARARAIDGRNFDNGHWVALAMTFAPDHDRVTVYCNGTATPLDKTDPVAQDVFRYPEPVAANPFHFPWPIYSPRAFVLKYNGYDVESSGVHEHWLYVDTERGVLQYARSSLDSTAVRAEYRIAFNVERDGAGLLRAPLVFAAVNQQDAALPDSVRIQVGDEIVTSLEVREGDAWKRVGTEIRYPIREGAPFTFGRALGLGTEPIDHGTQLLLDGVAVFNRVLTEKELKSLSFCGP
ncbi:MAG: hypothetical protein RBS80_13535 [Thermoguttaceae bacterium]|jgi:hypothetical protein|nr:hypothetical protein [Thermoguttaceae bacterium]